TGLCTAWRHPKMWTEYRGNRSQPASKQTQRVGDGLRECLTCTLRGRSTASSPSTPAKPLLGSVQRRPRTISSLHNFHTARYPPVTFRASRPLGVTFAPGATLMNQADDARINELCTLIGAEKDSVKVLWLSEELNRLLLSKRERLKSEGDV